MSDFDLQCITKALKSNHTLKVIDFSSNTDLTGPAITNFFDVLNSNRTLEYFGLSKLNLCNEDILPVFENIGKFPFPEDQVENQKAALK